MGAYERLEQRSIRIAAFQRQFTRHNAAHVARQHCRGQHLAVQLSPATVDPAINQDDALSASPAVGLDRKGIGKAGKIAIGERALIPDQSQGRRHRHPGSGKPFLGLELLVHPRDRFTGVEPGDEGVATIHSENGHCQAPLAARKRASSEKRRPL